MAERTPRTAAGASVPNGAPDIPTQQEDATHDGAPAGLWPTELPSVSVPGGAPMTLGGYAADNTRCAQISIEQDPRGLQSYKAPTGVSR